MSEPSGTQADRFYVEHSPIHGYGLFARTHIAAGELIGEYDGPRVYEEEDDGTYVLWVLDDDGQGYGVDGKNEMRYINHAADANAVFYETEIYALRDIEPGEEITAHYGADWDPIDEQDQELDEYEEEEDEDDDADEQEWLELEPEAEAEAETHPA